MRLVLPARADGMSVAAGRPTASSAAVALLLGVLALLMAFGFGFALTAVLWLIATFAALAWLCRRQIGGQTGDVLGALEQASEIVVLLVAAAAANTLR